MCRWSSVGWLVVVVGVSACSNGEDTGDTGGDEPRTVILDSRFAPADDTLGDGIQGFLDNLSAITDWNVEFADPSAGAGILNAVDAGDVDLGIDVMTIEDSGVAELNAVFGVYGESMPFGMGPDVFLGWLTEGGGLDLLHTMLVDDYDYDPNIRLIPVIANTGQGAGMFKTAPTKANLETGFLMRTFGNGQPTLAQAYPNMTFIGAVGGSVDNIVAGFKGELTGANCPDTVGPCELQGAEFVNPCIDKNQIYTQGIADEGVAYYYPTPWQSPATISMLMYRADHFDEAEQELLQIAARANIAESRPRLFYRQSSCLLELEDTYGQEIGTLDTDVQDDLRAAWAVVRASKEASNPHLATVLASMDDYVDLAGDW